MLNLLKLTLTFREEIPEYYQTLKQFGPRSDLIWIQSCVQMYHETALAGKCLTAKNIRPVYSNLMPSLTYLFIWSNNSKDPDEMMLFVK